MEKITAYVDNLFSGLPRTEDVAKVKSQIIDSLVEKYQDLLNSGKNENEAFGIVVAEFGSMEELKKQFDLPEYKENQKKPVQEKPELEEVSPEIQKYREEFFKYQKIYAVKIGLGVIFCILGIVISSLMKSDNAMTIGFFIPVAIGVFLFIIAGIKQESLKKLAHLDEDDDSSGNNATISSVIMITATIIFLLLGFLKNMWSIAWIVFPIGGLLCGLVAALSGHLNQKRNN